MRSAQSILCDRDRSRPTSLDVLSPFQRRHQSPLHALVVLVRESQAFLAPGVTIDFTTKQLQYDFPHQTALGSSMRKAVPSSLVVSDLTFQLNHSNPLFPTAGDTNAHRPILGISIRACGLAWGVVNTSNGDELDVPVFLNNSPVGLIYKVSSFSECPVP